MNKIIAISGPPGSGKTLLASSLADKIKGVFIDYDRYQQVTEQPLQEIVTKLESHLHYDHLAVPKLDEDLKDLKLGNIIHDPISNKNIKPKPYIIFETPLGREHSATGRHIDVLVWIDIPFDIALARNIQVYTHFFIKENSVDDLLNNIQWLNQYLKNYLEHVREMLLQQQTLIMKEADIVINGELDTNEMVNNLIKQLEM